MSLVIGYGNPLRTDDGLGQYLAERLDTSWEVITSFQLTPEMAEDISRAEWVVFIDSGIGEIPGEVTCTKVTPMPLSGAFSHNVTPASLLASSLELYGGAPQAILITVTAASFEFGCDFSPQISAMLPRIIRLVDEMIAVFFPPQTESIRELAGVF